ncbi:MAG: polysaccharide deacetylase family protein [Bacteroidetes Order II. Incertae sedis bacterium]|nr:polysaccharide deacetylase family protein [Bacteroidetes Order II. bacterium]
MFNIFATQTVRFLPRFYPDILWHRPTKEKELYITIDDGPTTACTGKLAKILDKFDAKATFFLIGQNVAAEPSLVRDLKSAGHTLGQHSHSHPNAWQLPKEQMMAEMSKATRILEEVVDESVRWMRPPYGRFTPAMRKWCIENEQKLVMWDLLPADYMTTVSEKDISRHICQFVRPGSIVVLHDNPKVFHKTPEALYSVLATLSAEGWRFRAL